MKRFTAGVVAVAAALPLSTGVAGAADGKTSSEVTDGEVGVAITKAVAKEAFGGDGFGSSIDVAADVISSKAEKGEIGSSDIENLKNAADRGSSDEFLVSTIKSDVANDWKIGQTLDIILGVTIAAISTLLVGGAAVGADAAGIIDIPWL